MPPSSESSIVKGRAFRGLTSRSLLKEIFDSDHPVQFTRSLPAQSLFLTIKRNGLESSGELVELLGNEQLQVILDLDCWSGDELNEESLWQWLALPEQTNSLESLQQVLRGIDFKLIGILISKYLTSETFEEPTDAPPGKEYFTPDKGYTWIKIDAPDSDKQFLLARLTALIFESDPDIFYQLLSIPGVATVSELEEEAYQDKQRRLLSEGIPNTETAFTICNPLNIPELLKQIQQRKQGDFKTDIRPIEPLVYDSRTLQPLGALLSEIRDREQLEGELSYIMNAAIVRWKIPSYDYEAVLAFTEQIKGTINIGLEALMRESDLEAFEIYRSTGLRPIFQAGLSLTLELRSEAYKLSDGYLEKIAVEDQPLFALVAALREPLPLSPAFLRSSRFGKLPSKIEELYEGNDDGKLLSGTRALETHDDVLTVRQLLKQAQLADR